MKSLNQWLFGYGSPVALGVFRLAIGFLSLLSLLTILLQFDALLGIHAYIPPEVTRHWLGGVDRVASIGPYAIALPFDLPRLSMVSLAPDNVTYAFLLLTTLAALFTTIGLHTRIASVILAIGVVSIHHRMAVALNGGDTLLRVCLIYLAFSPSGAACSIDRLREVLAGGDVAPKAVSLWPQRLIQINLALLYFTTVWDKWQGDLWRNGTATYYTARLAEFKRFPYPAFISELPMVKFTTYGTLIVELALATLVFSPSFRKWCMLAGLGLHGFIDYSMNIPFFGPVICSVYLVFFEGIEIVNWVERIGQKWKGLRWTLTLPEGKQLTERARRLLLAADPFDRVTIQHASVDHPKWGKWWLTPGLWFFPLAWREVEPC